MNTNRFLTADAYLKNTATPVFLYKKLWKENTTALLHAPCETDKTALALTVACELASSGRNVVYVAAERTINRHIDILRSAPSDLAILVPEFESPDDKRDYADIVISTIEEIVATTSYRTFIIDSVTRIAALSFGRNASVAYIMKRLVALQVRCRISILVISHDSTKATDRSLLNFADCEITIDNPDTDDTVRSEKQKTAASSKSHEKPLRCDSPKMSGFNRPDYS